MFTAVIIIVCVIGLIFFTAVCLPKNFPPGEYLITYIRLNNILIKTLIVTTHLWSSGPPGIISFYTMYKNSDSFFAKTITQMSSKYGSIVGLRLFQKKFICVSGYEAVTEALSNPALDSRPNSFDFNCRTSGLRRGIHLLIWCAVDV